MLNAHIDSNLQQLIHAIREPIYIVKNKETSYSSLMNQEDYFNAQQESILIGLLPAIYPEWLGDPHFLTTHGIRFPYIVGEMANGIATAKMVIAAAKAGMLGFFGAAGLMPEVVEENIHMIQNAVQHPSHGWGSNLIHSPQEPHLEEAIVDLYLRRHVTRVSASAYMSLSPHIVRYAATGLHQDSSGKICRTHYVLAKVSRPEVAKHFMSPAPADMLEQLAQSGKITPEEAILARHIPVAEDITIEADSGGHTDNRPLTALFSVIYRLAEELTQKYNYQTPLRLGAAGGLGTPAAVAAAFSLGAAYVLTGSINQAAIESGLSETGKELLLRAEVADVAMAPAADMFELGVKLQVLKRGTLFAMRAAKLYELYTSYDSLESLPEAEKNQLEKQIFGATLENIWELTEKFFSQRDPQQLIRAGLDSKHRMALVFRWYLGLSSRWAITGEQTRKADYQIWCGPAMGAFNKWAAGTFLSELSARTVEQIGRNLLEGAAIITRAHQLRSHGFIIKKSFFDYIPTPLS